MLTAMWLRLRQIALVARELRPVLADLNAVLDLHPCYVDPGVGTCGKEGQSVPVGVGQPTLRIDAMTVGGTN